jgi:hypothetical protein
MTLASNLATTARPEITAVSDLLEGVTSGTIRIPRFQRPYVWGPDDMIQLFDSVLRGYPIGSLLIWQTDRTDITSLETLGPIILPKEGPRLRQYVVDGHQRLATLLGVLMLPENYPRDRRDDWRWWIAYDLRTQQFIHLKQTTAPIPLHQLPLRSVLRTVDFARRTREMLASPDLESDIDELLDRADYVQNRIREYRVPTTVMRSGSLDDAVTIFARVNQRGRDMTSDQMVSTLTFRDKDEGDFDLAGEIDQILGDLREYGFSDLERRIVLQVILAAAELDFTRSTYDRIVDRSSVDRMRPAVQKAADALRQSARFLRRNVGITTSRLLPYASLIVMLSIHFEAAQSAGIPTSTDNELLLEKWFWATSFNGWFAGANTTELRQAGDAMRKLARIGAQYQNEFLAFFLDRPIRVFPETFDRRSARVRASLLVQIREGHPREPKTGELFDASAVFADLVTRDIPYFFPNKRRPKVSNPANRVILPGGYSRNARLAFAALDINDSEGRRILESHFVDECAYKALTDDDFETFISCREANILAAEKHFLLTYGLTVDSSAERSDEEIDADL